MRGIAFGVTVAMAVIALLLLPAGVRQWLALALVAALIYGITATIYPLLVPRHGSSRVSYGLLLSIVWVAVVVVSAVFAPLLPIGNYADSTASFGVTGFLPPDLLSEHPLGTNRFGLDILSRLVWGSRSTLFISLIAVTVGIGLGTVFGAASGYFGGAVDRGSSIVTNIGLAFPPLILLMIVSPLVGKTTGSLALVFAVLIVPGAIRLARGNTLTLSQRPFITASRGLGGGTGRVLFREILPNLAPSMFIYGLISLPSVVVATASLSFLGLGPSQPDPTWGNMIAEGLNGVFEKHPLIVIIPSVVLTFTVLSFSVIGKSIQKRDDSRQAKA